MPVRDEADIIEQSLSALLTWADAIYVFDTGSVDETWDIIQAAAEKDNRIMPLRRDPVFFCDTKVRAWLFHEARQHMRGGDWFLRVDADEVHHIPPPEFIKTRMRKCETVAWHQYYNFSLTEAEVCDWERGAETTEDRARPIADRRRWFIASTYSEPRLCRYRSTMQWPADCSFPINAGYIAHERLPIRHYPHRDPPQLDRRCRLRAAMMGNHDNRRAWSRADTHHWNQPDWRSFITPNESPGLTYWQPGTELPRYRFTNHLAPLHRRITQRLAHACLLPWLDLVRPMYRATDYPTQIPGDLQNRLEFESGRRS